MKRLGVAAVLVVVVVSVYARCYRLLEPWPGGHNGWGGAVYGLIARNYVKFGFEKTMLGPVVNGGVVPPERFEYYYHHPPLQVWLMSVSYRVFGDHEASARAVPLVFSLLSLLLLYLLARRWFGHEVALLAAVVMAVLPVETYYGAHAEVYGSQAVFFSILAVYGYLRWLETGTRRELGMCVAGIVLGCCTSWFGYFLIPPILVHHHFTRVRQGRSSVARLWVLPAAAVVLFLCFLVHRGMLPGDGRLEQMGALSEKFQRRVSPPRLEDGRGNERSWAVSFVLLSGRWLGSMFTPVPSVLMLAWLLLLARDWRRGRVRDPEWAVLFFLAMGTLHNLTFPGMLKPHNYIVASYSPAVALSAAAALWRGYRRAVENWGQGIAMVVLVAGVSAVVASCALGNWRLFHQDDLATGRRLKERGVLIARGTRPTDTVLLPPTDDYEVKVLRYYSDRNLGLVAGPGAAGRVVFVCSGGMTADCRGMAEAHGERSEEWNEGGIGFVSVVRR